jgi:hypothetical protein
MLFKRKKKNTPKVEGVVKLKQLNYPPKILIGWAEAIGGNKKLTEWFLESPEYRELGMTVYALQLKDDARDWLMKNGFAHLMAMVNGCEGSEEAIHWLDKSNFQVLKHLALAGDGHEVSFKWLVQNGHKEFAIVAQRIKVLKDQIEERNNDIHSFGSD